jgi:dGTPase
MGPSIPHHAPLARLRFPVEASQGRRYPEPPHPYRDDFQRDRGRIVHARAFRRLENKTQVFGAGLYDHFRNRLTHTIEVAQIARATAAALGLNEELTETLALAHDIGHPPFAHSGEDELNRQMARFGDRFDHNLHALRIVEHFEQRYAGFPGLNLTFEVREGMVKHSRDITSEDAELLAEYLPGERPPLEAQLIDLADEVAYNTADLDDGYEAELFRLDDVVAEVPNAGLLREEIEAAHPQAEPRIVFQEIVRRLVDELASGLIEGTSQAAVESGVGSWRDVRKLPNRIARMTGGAASTDAQLKSFLRRRLYYSDALVAERTVASAHVARLFQHYVEKPSDMPENYVRQTETIPVYRIVCDYIAGMTDRYFSRTYRQVFGEN